ncbi:hypothetical protein SUGI_0846450 [Cryptomeria japonica]|nr:hypothetical protein SUGI_0846450 [Cryptomeria japonica]
MMMQYSDMHSDWMAFPLFAYIMAVTVVGEASLGEALRSAFSVMAGVLHGALPAILVLWVIKPERFSTWVTTLCVTVSSFLIVWSNMIHITSKRVACAQVVMIYVSAFSNRENLDPVMYPLRVAATTFVGTACALLALIFPVPRLACYQVQEKSKLTARITSEVLRILVEAFSANDYKEVNSLRFQAKSLSSAGLTMLEKVQNKQDYLRWELPGLGYSSSVSAISKEFCNLRQSLAGMEMALQYSSTFEIGPLMHALLKDPLLYLAEWTSLALKQAGSVCFARTNTMPNQEELIVEKVRAALNSLDEVLTVLTQRAYHSNMQKPNPSNKSSDHETLSSDAFGCYLPTFFFMFNLKRLCKEAIDVLCYSDPSSEKLQQIVPMGNGKQETSTLSQNNSDYCRLCALPLTTISINVDAPQQGAQTEAILQWLIRYFCQIYRDRMVVPLKCSLSLGLSVLTGILISSKHGFWGGIAVAISLSSSREATFKLGNVRVQGTVAGSIYGVIGSVLTEKYMVLGIVALIPWVVFTSFLRQSKMYGYAGGVSAVVSAVFILGRKTSPSPSVFAMERITETMVGIVCYMVVELILQPRRAATIARKELVLTLSHLQEYTTAIISAQITQQCIHSLPAALSQFKDKENALKYHICQLRRSIEEAKTEPDFWFLPFPETIYSKLLGDVCKIGDLLHFSMRSYESIIESCSSSHISIEAIYDLIRDDLQEFGYRVSPPYQCFVQVLEVKSIPKLIFHHHNHQHHTFADLESGSETQPAHEEHPHNSELRQISQSIADDEDAINSLLKSIKVLMADACLTGRDVGGLNNDLIIALSSLAFCLDNMMKELKQVERDIHEILQWENPWSLIDMWEIRSMLNEEVPYKS